MTFVRLGYEVGSDVRVTIDAHSNLQSVHPPHPESAHRPIKI